MRKRCKAPILALMAMAVAVLLPGSSRASLDLPAPDRALLLELGVPDLSIGLTGETGDWQPRGGLRYRLGSDVLSAQVGGLGRLVQLGLFGFDLGADAGPLLALREGLVIGGLASGHAAVGLLLDDWDLRIGPRAELALAVDYAGYIDVRADVLAACAVGWTVAPVAVWLRLEAGYSVGGEGAGAATGRLALVLDTELRTLGIR